MSRTTWSLTTRITSRPPQFFHRVADELEALKQADVTDRNGSADVLTVDHIDDIAARTARKTADEVETRFR